MFFSPTLFGQSETAGDPLIRAAGASLIFGIIGIVLLIVGYFLFDWLCRRIDIQSSSTRGTWPSPSWSAPCCCRLPLLPPTS